MAIWENRQVPVGAEFYSLTVLEHLGMRPVANGNRRRWMWRCQCSCGKVVERAANDVMTGNTKTCGHSRADAKRPRLYPTPEPGTKLTGTTLTFVAEVRKPDHQGRQLRWWTCTCECGVTRDLLTQGIVSGRTTSCSCGRMKSDTAYNKVEAGYRNSARSKGLTWALSREEFRQLVISPCHYCGQPPQAEVQLQTKRSRPPVVCNGIDRVDNSLGYERPFEQAVPCCSTCNYAKRDMPLADFNAWLDRVFAHRNKTAA